VNGNSLELNWEEVVSKEKLSYILGNPPFIGSKLLNPIQRKEMETLFFGVKNGKILDYVTAWYLKAAKFIQGSEIKVAFVSTNSISQGEQVGVLWKELFENYNIKIHFAHQTFNWSNEAKSNAAVHVVIIGFANFDTDYKRIYEYENIKSDALEKRVKNINPYLVEGDDIVVLSRSKPLGDVPKMSFGNMPLDGGNLLIADEEIEAFLHEEPMAKKYVLPLISAREFLNGKKRWCLWLEDISPNELRSMPLVMQRVEQVKLFRESSKAPSTQKHALTPTLFRDRNRPDTFIVLPRHFSVNREYLTLGYFDSNNIVSDSCLSIPNGDIYLFGQLTSIMHMVWMRYTSGRLKSDYRYSKDLVYNNYPFPKDVSIKNRELVEKKAQNILDIRASFPDSSLADLYDPLAMPPKLKKAHQELDKAVDKCYTKRTFKSDKERIEFLFDLYEKYIAEENNA
jgi:hypothetical protein